MVEDVRKVFFSKQSFPSPLPLPPLLAPTEPLFIAKCYYRTVSVEKLFSRERKGLLKNVALAS